MATDLEELYRQHLEHLTPEDRLRLIEMLSRDAAQDPAEEKKPRDLMGFHGLGKEIWEGVNADDYVKGLRDEWDHRP